MPRIKPYDQHLTYSISQEPENMTTLPPSTIMSHGENYKYLNTHYGKNFQLPYHQGKQINDILILETDHIYMAI